MSKSQRKEIRSHVRRLLSEKQPDEIATEVEAELNQLTSDFREEYELITGQELDWMGVFNALRKTIEPTLTEVAMSR